jgi:hypothetical protein
MKLKKEKARREIVEGIVNGVRMMKLQRPGETLEQVVVECGDGDGVTMEEVLEYLEQEISQH